MSELSAFVPKFIVCLREGYTRERFGRDLIAGVVVGIVALPLALAFAIASGVPPERGLYTAIIAGFLISALGGSRVAIGGPTGAFVVIVYGIVAKHGYDGLAAATIIAGFLLILLGLLRLGALIKFIPYPVITGFTSGIAVIIFTSQIKDFFGLKIANLPAEFVEKIQVLARQSYTFDMTTVSVGICTLVILILWPKRLRAVPSAFVAMLVMTAVVQLMHLPVETIASRFGGVPNRLPSPQLPAVPWNDLRELISPAVTIALLAAIESLLCAMVADGMIGTRHRSNTELIAQGVANVVSPIFGGIPATGAIARTATNIRAGGRTPLAGMTHALTLFLILILFGKWAGMVPLATLAAVLFVVSYHMSEWRSFRSLLRAPRSDVAILLVTFLLTVFVDLTVAVQVGFVVAAILFMRRMAEVTSVSWVTEELADSAEDPGEITEVRRRKRTIGGVEIPQGVDIFEISGPFFFGAADKLRDATAIFSRTPKVLILRMRHVPTIDATGLLRLEQLFKESRAQGTTVVLCELGRSLLRVLIRSKKVDVFGRENLVATLPFAVDRATEILHEKPPTRERTLVRFLGR